MLTFSQINLHKSSGASDLAGRGLEGKAQTIMLITEPYTKAGKITGMPRGTKIVFDKNLKSSLAPRAGIVASKDLQLTAMESWCNRDCAVALMRLQGKQTIIASVYLDIQEAVCQSWLDKLVQMATKKDYALILGMDSNAHSTLYGPVNNKRGEEIEDFVLKHQLRVENCGNVPTFEIMRGAKKVETFIDVTLTRGLPMPIAGWMVDRSYNQSDHNTIRFGITIAESEPEIIRPWSKADWGIFASVLKENDYTIPKDMSMKKLDKLLDKVYKALNLALDRACPQIKIIPKIRGSHWATEEHENEKKKVGKLYKKAISTRDPMHWDEYRKADKAFKRRCKKDKNRAWRKFKECIQSEKEMSQLAKMAQRTDRREINVLQKPDGGTTDPGEETVKLLTETHFPSATNVKHVTYNNRRNCPVDKIQEKYKSWITRNKIRLALEGFEKKKSPGPDEIKPLLFEHLPDEFLDVLQLIYKSCIHLGYTPKAWKRTKAIFISKPGKESYEKPKSFRPISLSNYLLKGLERLVGWNMDKALKNNPIHTKQHGFLAGKSTESAISNTVDYIERHNMLSLIHI